MKKLIIFIILICLSSVVAADGIELRTGAGYIRSKVASNASFAASNPLSLGVEARVSEPLGVGMEYRKYIRAWADGSGDEIETQVFSCRAVWYFLPVIVGLEPYFGAALNYNVYIPTIPRLPATSTYLHIQNNWCLEPFAGAKLTLADNIKVYMQGSYIMNSYKQTFYLVDPVNGNTAVSTSIDDNSLSVSCGIIFNL